MKKLRIICRNSRLSLLQAELVKRKIQLIHPALEVEIHGRSSRGDKELHRNLSLMEGTDFFTEEIFRALQNGEADIAVHSLKDMSAEHFFSHPAFAVVDRDDPRDLALFNPAILSKIKAGKPITIGTCSPRREVMAVRFLERALPRLQETVHIETKPIRGNVESRLKQLQQGDYDGTILATAGLNRLLKSASDAPAIRALLDQKLKMLLPLIECVPAPCQGAIVAEADPRHRASVALLQQINDPVLFEEACQEKKEGYLYGTGCQQKFGVTTIKTSSGTTRYAAGETNTGEQFAKWSALPSIDLSVKTCFAGTDFMKSFFAYERINTDQRLSQPVVFVANYKALQGDVNRLRNNSEKFLPSQQNEEMLLGHKTIIASGTKTWIELAKLGYWVTASADGFGFESVLPVLAMPVLNIPTAAIGILTHEEGAKRWKQKGYKAIASYRLNPAENHHIIAAIGKADFIFWASFSQFYFYGKYANKNAQHACGSGVTASLLIEQGIKPIIFPTIQSFQQWKQSITRPINEGSELQYS